MNLKEVIFHVTYSTNLGPRHLYFAREGDAQARYMDRREKKDPSVLYMVHLLEVEGDSVDVAVALLNGVSWAEKSEVLADCTGFLRDMPEWAAEADPMAAVGICGPGMPGHWTDSLATRHRVVLKECQDRAKAAAYLRSRAEFKDSSLAEVLARLVSPRDYLLSEEYDKRGETTEKESADTFVRTLADMHGIVAEVVSDEVDLNSGI